METACFQDLLLMAKLLDRIVSPEMVYNAWYYFSCRIGNRLKFNKIFTQNEIQNAKYKLDTEL
jgi:hypothetical protein